MLVYGIRKYVKAIGFPTYLFNSQGLRRSLNLQLTLNQCQDIPFKAHPTIGGIAGGRFHMVPPTKEFRAESSACFPRRTSSIEAHCWHRSLQVQLRDIGLAWGCQNMFCPKSSGSLWMLYGCLWLWYSLSLYQYWGISGYHHNISQVS